MPSPSLFTANPVSIHGEYIQLQALTGTAPVAASQSVGRIFASGSTAALYFINEGGTVQAFGGADPPSADGDSLGTVDLEWSDLYMADGSVIYLGNDQDVTLTHVHNEGVILNSTMKLFFEDATNKDQYIASLGSGVTGIAAPTEIDLTAPTIDINASSEVNISGDVDVAGHDASSAGLKLGGTLVTSTAAELNLVDGSSANTVVNSKAVIYGSSGEIKGNALSGTTVTVDAITSTGLSTFGSSKHTTLSGTTVQVNQGNLYIDGGRMLSTATELNLLDGDTSVGSSITIATTDGIIINDGGTTKLVPMSDMEVFMESNLDTLANVTTVGALNAGSITSGFGNIDNGSSNITNGGLVKLDVDADADDLTADSATGRLTIGAGEDLNLYHGGTNSYIVNDTGDLILDTAGDIVLDGDGADLVFKDGGTEIGRLTNSSTNYVLGASVNNASTILAGVDAGASIQSLVIDHSDAGRATFNNDVRVGVDCEILGDLILGAGANEFTISESSDDITMTVAQQDKDLTIAGNDGGSTVNAVVFDMSDAGRATFNDDVRVGTDCEVLGDLIVGAGANEFSISESSDDITMAVLQQDKDLTITGNDGGSTINALVLDMSAGGAAAFSSTVTAVGSFIIGSADMSEADLEKLDGITNGTAAANKALVLDANKAIGTISHLTASNIKCDTLDVREINSISETALTLEVVDKTILAGLSGSSSDVNNGGYQIGGTIGDGGMARMLWSDTGQALMFYSGSSALIAVGKDVIGPATNDGAALGMATKAYSDLFLASGAVVNFDNGDVTMTHSANTLTVAGGTLAAAGVTTSGRVQVDDTTEATSTTDGSLQTDGGLSVAKSVVVGDDLDLLSNGAILNIGNGSKFTLTDQNSNNTVMASANHRLAFGDAGEYITGDGTDLSIISSGDLKIDPAGGTVDVDGNIVPNSDSADDLGASGTAWANLYVDAIDLNGQGSISMGGTGRIDLDADDDTSIRASADDVIMFEVGGSDELALNGTALGPASNDGLALGVAGQAFADLFLASGAVINFNNGGVTMTHSAGYLTLNPGSNMKAHAFVTYSDGRMKKNIKQLDTALDTVQKLRGVSYDWKSDGSSDIGFIAQEVAEVVPSLCHGSEEDGYALDYPSMNALLVEAVKQQQQQIKALSAKVEKLSK